uniref:Uncharacterized protein n=1 Tax=Molossus molossus TaxID=27622 RepID=A0A7J8FSQ1_MOLMO|nr:hypothetical protein HJG59_008412 [Molossus molossus]
MTIFLIALPPLESRVSGVNKILCIGSLRVLLSLADLHLSLVDRIPAGFYSQMLSGHFFQAVMFWAGKRGLGLRPHTSQGGPLQLRYPSEISAAVCGSRVIPFSISAFPTSHHIGSSIHPWL